MAFNLLTFAFAVLLGSWIALLVALVRAKRKIELLEGHVAAQEFTNSQLVNNLRRMGNAALSTEVSASLLAESLMPNITYPDKDGDGVPDVFQRRRPLSEILEFEKDSVGHVNDYWVAIELPPRSPKKDEYYISPTGIHKSEFDFTQYSTVIVKAVPGTNLDDLVDLTK